MYFLNARLCLNPASTHTHTRFADDLHSSNSIEGEYVPVEGDEVSYKICSIPPKHAKIQAVEVTITHLAPGTKHETWSGAVFESWGPWEQQLSESELLDNDVEKGFCFFSGGLGEREQGCMNECLKVLCVTWQQIKKKKKKIL